MSRPPFARMLIIHERLRAGTYPNCANLSRHFEVAEKTIQRDIEFMRDQLHLPIDYEAGRRGYYYTEEVTSFPSVQITEGELMALLVAGKALEQYRGTPFEKQLSAAFTKLTAGLDDTISFTAGAALAAVSFSAVGQTEIAPSVFEPLCRGIANRREIEFSYRKPGAGAPELRRVQPYHLAYRDNLCYLIARDCAKAALRQFALPRISKVKLLTGTFEIPLDFSVESFFRGAFGAQSGQSEHQVRIRFDAKAADYIRERRWHTTQTLENKSDGGVEIQFRLSDLEEVERWILSWGAHAQVIGPPELIDRTRRTILTMAGYYPK